MRFFMRFLLISLIVLAQYAMANPQQEVFVSTRPVHSTLVGLLDSKFDQKDSYQYRYFFDQDTQSDQQKGISLSYNRFSGNRSLEYSTISSVLRNSKSNESLHTVQVGLSYLELNSDLDYLGLEIYGKTESTSHPFYLQGGFYFYPRTVIFDAEFGLQFKFNNVALAVGYEFSPIFGQTSKDSSFDDLLEVILLRNGAVQIHDGLKFSATVTF